MNSLSLPPWNSELRLLFVALSTAEAAIGEVKPGIRVVGLTKGQFSLIDLIGAVLKQIGPAEIMVSTWTPGKLEIEAVATLLDNHYISRFRLLVDRSFVTRHADYVQRVHEVLGSEAIRQTRTHAKFALIKGGDYRISIRTSMNFNRNPRFEQFDLDDNPEIFAFFDKAVEDLYDSVPPGLDADRSKIERGFRISGNLFRMNEKRTVPSPEMQRFMKGLVTNGESG